MDMKADNDCGPCPRAVRRGVLHPMVWIFAFSKIRSYLCYPHLDLHVKIPHAFGLTFTACVACTSVCRNDETTLMTQEDFTAHYSLCIVHVDKVYAKLKCWLQPRKVTYYGDFYGDFSRFSMCVDPMFPAYLQIVACLVCWILSLTTRPIHQIILPAKWKGSRRFRVRHRLKWLEVATLWQQRCVQIQKAGHLSVTGWRIGLSLPRHPVKLAKKCLACNVLSLSTLLCLILGTYENIVTPVIYFMLANEFHFPLPLCRAVTALCVTLQTPQCCGWQIWLCLVACSWFRPSFPVSPTASEPPSGKVPAYLLVHPFESFDRKILVPKSTISRLKSAGLIEELATETASLNHFGWIESIAVSKRCEALLAALPEGKQKQLFSQQLSSQGFASDVSPAAAADSTPQDSSPDCLRIDQEFLKNAASGSQLPEPDRKKLAQYAQLLGIAQKKPERKKTMFS